MAQPGGVGARLGLECAGEVEAVGDRGRGLKPGRPRDELGPRRLRRIRRDRCGRVHRIPANNMSYEQAACLPVALQTMHNAMVTAGRLKRGERLLIQGASSGRRADGHADRQVYGCRAGDGHVDQPGRRARLKEFGCDLALDSSDAELAGAGEAGDGRQGRRPHRRPGVGERRQPEPRRRRRSSAASSMSAASAA